MNRLRCVLFAALVLISSTTLASAGVIQGPAKSEPTPTPTPTALTTSSTSGSQPASTEGVQLVWQDATTLLVEILLAIF